MLPKCCCGVILWILIGLVLVFFIAQRMRKAVELVFEEYEAVKLELWKKYEHNRDAYTEAKTDFIRKWTAEAHKIYGDRYR